MNTLSTRPLGMLLFAVGLLWVLAFGYAPPAAAQEKGLVAVQTDKAPVIDGTAEDTWSKAPAFTIPLSKTVYDPSNGYKGMQKTTVTMKSLYDAEHIYFLVEWTDPTDSLDRQPWVKQGDGSWKQQIKLDDTGNENTSFEDKLGLMWNISSKDFETRGCSSGCHKSRAGKLNGIEEKLPARKYTNNSGDLADLWEWKAVSTNPVGRMDDGYIDDNRDPKKNADWGLHEDSSTGGGTVPNDAKTKPAFMNAAAGGPATYVLGSAKAPFVDTFKPGDKIGSVVVAPATGSRGDIEAKGIWKAGKWTVEIKRKRATATPKEDVQFTDAKKAYAFGVSIFDNTSINHLFVEGVHKMTLK